VEVLKKTSQYLAQGSGCPCGLLQSSGDVTQARNACRGAARGGALRLGVEHSLLLSLDEAEPQRVLGNVRRRDLVPEVVVVIFHAVLSEYLQNEYVVDLARRARLLPLTPCKPKGGVVTQSVISALLQNCKQKYRLVISDCLCS
jgi:hypothetical protein